MDTAINVPKPTVAPKPAGRVPWSQRVNLRMLGFIAVALLLVGYPVYLALDLMLSQGIWHKDDARYGRYVKVDLQAMSSSFEIMDPAHATDAVIPERYRQLNGQRVMLVGEMVPDRNAVGAQAAFDLVYSISKCCFSGPPKIQHFIKCDVQPGRKQQVQYHPGLVRAVGTLEVGIVRDEAGAIASVFRLKTESTEPD